MQLSRLPRIILICLAFVIATGCAAKRPALKQGTETKLRVLLKEGYEALAEKKYNESLATFQVASELSPYDERVLDALGVIYYHKGDLATATAFFKKAISENPDYSRPYGNLAIVAEDEGDYTSAVGLYQKAIKVNPLNYKARHNYGLLLIRAGYKAEGEAELRRAQASKQKQS